MNEKSLIYSLLSKFLDDNQEDGIPEHAGEDEREGESRTQGQSYDDTDREDEGTGGQNADGARDGRGQDGRRQDGRSQDGRSQDGRRQDGKSQDSRSRNGRNQNGRDQDSDHRVETVEDWNEAEVRRREQVERELLGKEQTGADGQDASDWDMSGRDAYDQDSYGGTGYGDGRPGGYGSGQGGYGSGQGEDVPAGETDQDAWVELIVADDRMSVSMMVHGPRGEGQDVSRAMIHDALEQKGICFGVDEEKIGTIVNERQYLQMAVIANGMPAINGEDGRIKDYFPRKAQLKYASKGNGGIDFKSMNLIHNVQKGDVVCDITMPTEPEDGVDVFGEPVRGKNGTMPPIPQGRNIVYTPERDKLVTACEGNLTFRSGRFHVENIFSVSGNVDNSVGNIDFTGSVVVHGDVLEGYRVIAKGDITVMGIVEGAYLKAGGDILLHKGMRGMKSGVLEADGDITAKFLEDCNIYAKNNIQAEYIINSEVSCGHDLTLMGKRGAFIGGNCSVYNCMNVKAVGAPSHITTSVTLGLTPQLMEEMEAVGKEMLLLSRKLTELNKDISYLNGKLKEGSITPIQRDRLAKLKLEAPINSLKEKKLKQQGAELSRKLREVGKSRLTAREVYPGSVINIGDCKMSITKKEDNCTFYYLDGEIRKGIR